MSGIVFGSPEPAAVLQRDRTIAALEEAAVENADGGFWVSGVDLTPDQRSMVRCLVSDGSWECNAGNADYMDNWTDAFRDYRPNADERERLTAAYTEAAQ